MFRIADVPRAMVAMSLWCLASSAFAAENDSWSVSKSSGEVWVTATSADPVSLKQEDVLKPGDTIRTGRSGRVLLVRGEETILIAPNSVIGLPTEKKDGLSTTILQQAGSILLDVEKRNVKHFEVETPYLAAVVKGTQFAVTVNAGSTSVDVRRGQVEVSDFKSGQIAQVMPGQVATAFAHGKPGLSLSGTGQFHPIEQGRPRASSIEQDSCSQIGAVRAARDRKRQADPCAQPRRRRNWEAGVHVRSWSTGRTKRSRQAERRSHLERVGRGQAECSQGDQRSRPWIRDRSVWKAHEHGVERFAGERDLDGFLQPKLCRQRQYVRDRCSNLVFGQCIGGGRNIGSGFRRRIWKRQRRDRKWQGQWKRKWQRQ